MPNSAIGFSPILFQGNFTPRLYNGTSVYEGRLEVWEGNQWRRVCSSTIGSQEADVICKQLGHKSLETFYNWPKFGNGINSVLSWSFRCNDMVPFLNQCDYSYITSRKLDCNSVAVKCFSEFTFKVSTNFHLIWCICWTKVHERKTKTKKGQQKRRWEKIQTGVWMIQNSLKTSILPLW